MKKITILILLFCLINCIVQSQIPSHFGCGTTGNNNVQVNFKPKNAAQNCKINTFSNFLNEHRDDMVPQGIDETIKIAANVVFVQNSAGEGSYSISNPQHMAFWNNVFTDMNQRMRTLNASSCSCTPAPVHYSNTHLEFVPNYIELKNDIFWNHNNDQQSQINISPPETCGVYNPNSERNNFVTTINNLATQAPGYKEGISAIITTDGDAFINVLSNGLELIQTGNNINYAHDYCNFWYSMWPDYSFSQDAYWHAPDAFLQHLNGQQASWGGAAWVNGPQLSFMSGSFLHEMGHYFDLKHKNSCSDNIMNQQGPRTSLTGCQVREMYEAIMTQSTREFVICEDVLDYEITVDKDETWEMSMRFFTDIVIKDGATLTVTCELQMPNKGRIIVEDGGKLIVDGGILTSACESWDGIKVTGGDDEVDVQFTNDAIIENVDGPAVSMFPALPYNEAILFGNGILEADNTTFNNCKKMVEFAAYNISTNNSFIRDCTQNGGKWGISNWNCQGIEVTGNEFFDIEAQCIVSSTGSFNITDNKFRSGAENILYVTTTAGFGSSIIENEFIEGEVGIRAIGTTFGKINIHDNEFRNSTYGVLMDHDNNFQVVGNVFDGSSVGNVNFSTGNQWNTAAYNSFVNNGLGIAALNKNLSFTFTSNCFQTGTDVWVSGNISPIQGNVWVEAGNCFTHQGAPGTVSDIITNSSFNYHLKEDNELNCFDVFGSSVSLKNANIINGNPDCEIDRKGSEGDFCNPNNEDALASLNWLEEELNEDIPASVKNQYRGCILKIRAQYAETLMKDGDFEAARSLFTNESSSDDKIAIFSTYLLENDLINAEIYLNAMESSSEGLSDFILVQNINLNRLNNGILYQLSEANKTLLESIAEKNHPYAAYANSLLFVLTGELVDPEIELPLQNRTSNIDELKEGANGLSVYPNPFGERLVIQVSGKRELNIVVRDFQGRVVVSKNDVSESFEIQTTGWQNGLYFIEMIEGAESIFQEKILLVK